ncbi:MAG: AraC family transcriptional regulator [Paludibacteraceae bacterium]
MFDSILPYYKLHGENLPIHLTDIKLEEAITIIPTVDMDADSILANFSEQGKIDLADFMQKNYSFNIPLERFAYLTGRSLATFKRDFQKSFNISPQKWLLETRLKHAHYLISEKHRKPSDVYLEVGFENLSHFSNAFKLYFGCTPSKVLLSH